MTGLLFVTAPEADHKAINRILLYLRDWEYECGDSFKLATTKNAYDLENVVNGESGGDVEPTHPPVQVNLDNAWAGSTLDDIEAYCLDLDRNEKAGVNTHLYVLVDSQGLEEMNCILGERVISFDEDDKISYPERFNKFRLPWDELYLTWCNLNISNMDFADFAEEDDANDGDTLSGGWWTYSSVANGPDLSDDKRQERDDEIEKMRRESKI